MPLPCKFGAAMAIMLCFIPVFGVLAPRSLSFLPGVIALIGFGGHWYIHKTRLQIDKATLLIAISTFGLALLSCIWAIDPADSLERSLKLIPIFLSAVLLISFVKAQGLRFAKLFAKLLIISVLAGALYNAIELISDGWIYDALRGVEYVEKENLSHLNRGVVVITLLLFSAFTALRFSYFVKPSINYAYWIGFIALTVIAFVFSDSQSAQLAFAVGLLAFVFFPANIKSSWRIFALILGAIILASPWIAQYLFALLPIYIGDIEWFQNSYSANRLEIWDFVARYALENPLYGFGIEATKAVEDFDTRMLYHEDTTVLHPHNFALQFWIEFGVIGALFISAVIYYLFHIASYLKAPAGKLALASILAYMSVAATGYGFWQGWYLGLMIVMAAYCVILNKLVEDKI